MVGHVEHGRTIAVHSVCVLPTHQHLGLGKMVLKAFIQRMETSGIAGKVKFNLGAEGGRSWCVFCHFWIEVNG